MRLKLFKEKSKDGSKEYWTYTTKAFKHEESKLKWFIKFVNCIEPIANKGYSNQREYEYADVDIQECALGNTAEYNGRLNPIITIFAYTEVKQEARVEASDMKEIEKVNSTLDKAKELAKDNNIPINISSEELPFYGG